MKTTDLPLVERVITHYMSCQDLEREEAIRYIADDIAFSGPVRFAKQERVLVNGSPQTFLDDFVVLYDREITHPHATMKEVQS